MILIALTTGVCAIQHEPNTTSRASARVGAKERFMVMLRGYFDDSGTHVGGGAGASRLVVVGGVLASDDQYDRMKETWDVILKRNHLPYFHLTKFKTGKTSPYSTMSDGEKEILLDQIMRVMSVRVRMSCSAVIPVAAYEAALNEEEKKRYGNPYRLAAQWCWMIIRMWAEKHDYADPIPFVVERGATGEEELSVVFNKALSNPTLKELYRLHSLTCGDKVDFPGLQAADIIANSTYELGEHMLVSGRAPTRWMNIISHYVNKMDHRQLIANEELLRSETDQLNKLYQTVIA